MKKYLWILWIFLWLAFTGFVAKTAWNMGLQHEGVCVALGRPLTDEEKIRAVIKEMNRPITSVLDMSSVGVKTADSRDIGYIRSRKVPYKSVDEFLKKNPNCCSVKIQNTYSGNTDPRERTTEFDKAMGVYAGHVTVNYTLHYIDKDGIEQEAPDRMVWTIQNCGVVN